MQRAQSEAQEELQRVSDIALKREEELEEAINKLEVRLLSFACLLGCPSWVIYINGTKK